MKYMMIVCYDPALDSVQDDGGMDIDTWVSEMDAAGSAWRGMRSLPTTPPRSGCAAARC